MRDARASTTARPCPTTSRRGRAADRHGRADGRRRRGRPAVAVPGAGDRAAARSCVARDAPVLGICLGSQLLAAAAGARVYPNTRPGTDGKPEPAREVGWGPVELHRRRARAGAGGPARAAAGPALARRHLRSAARRGAPRVDAGLPPPGLPARAAAVRPAVSLRARAPRPSPSGCARTPTTCAAPAAPTAARSILRRHRAPLRAGAPGLGSPARQHHSSRHAIVRRATMACPAATSRSALVQMRCSTDPDDNLARAIARIARRRRTGRAGRLPARAVPQPVLLPDRGPRQLRPGRADPGPDDRGARATSRARRAWSIIGSLFERRAAGVYHNTAVVIDADGTLLGIYRKMHIPDDPLYLREVLLHARRSRVPRLRHRVRPHRHARLLGPVVPRGGAADRAGGRRGAVLSDGDRLAPVGEGRVRRGAARRLADHPARARHRQRRLRRGRQPRRPREPAGATATGIEFWGGSFVADPFGVVLAEASRDRGRDADRRPAIAGTRRRSAATGRSCATAASTPTAPITRRFIDE